MHHFKKNIIAIVVCSSIIYSGCKAPSIVQDTKKLPAAPVYSSSQDTTNTATIQWRNFFTDKYLVSLIDTALKNNQDLLGHVAGNRSCTNDIRVRQGQLSPTVSGRGGLGVEKVGRYTSQGAGDASTEIKPGIAVPGSTGRLWIWCLCKLGSGYLEEASNSKKAAVTRYLATIEGKNFLVTNLIAEIANSYYELLALDNQLDIVRQTIQLATKCIRDSEGTKGSFEGYGISS
jgi:outer membrane protein TolC